ncbi:MAG: sigma-70 family RNA polymerase sigma factor [Bacteroidota bacterium]|nr:sigma-70 family RNA polymerase sigma factor [Bacteroidota bacterium]
MQKELYSHFSSKMYGICMRYAKDRDEASDLLQEGFIKVFDNLHKFKKEGSLEGWIRRIMINVALSNFRKNHHLYAIVNIDNIEIKDELPEDENIMNEIEINEVLEIIRELPAGYQMVLNLYAMDGYSHKKIAQQLGISESTSKSQLSRARVILVNKIKENISKKKLKAANEG